jgi:putative membrane protein
MSSDDRVLWILLAVAAIVLLVPFLSMALMMPMMGMWGWGQMGRGSMLGGGGGAWLWLLMWLIVLLVVIGGGYLLYRAVRRPGDRDTDTALEELRLTYARGELTDDEFEKRYERLQREG